MTLVEGLAGRPHRARGQDAPRAGGDRHGRRGREHGDPVTPSPEPLGIKPPPRHAAVQALAAPRGSEGLTRLAFAAARAPAQPGPRGGHAHHRPAHLRQPAAQRRLACGEAARARPQGARHTPERRPSAATAYSRSRAARSTRSSRCAAPPARPSTLCCLTAVALMLSRFLGADAPDHAVALVPVSVRTDADDGELGNRISTVFVDLPLSGDAARAAASASARAMDDVKGSAAGARGRADRRRHRPGAARASSSLAVRAMSGPRDVQPRGLQRARPAADLLPGRACRCARSTRPCRSNPRNQALSIGIVSYDGGVGFGLLGDRDALADIGDAAAGVEAAAAELVEAADSPARGPAPSVAPALMRMERTRTSTPG